MAYRRRRRTGGYGRRRYGRRGMMGRRRYARSSYRPRVARMRGRGRYRGRGSRGGQTVRLVIQTPSDMLPPRPVAGQFARVRRRARF